ncbi:MAG: EAL domain-containing protein [Myxococcota bacterium]
MTRLDSPPAPLRGRLPTPRIGVATTPITGRVLVADDDDGVRRLVVRSLRRVGHDVVEATDGTEAIGLLARERFDAVLSDIVMPGADGLEVLRVARRTDLDVPVLLMTGDPSLATAIRAIEFGAVSYLVKPFEPGALETEVGRALRLHGFARLKRRAMEIAGKEGGQLADRASLEVRLQSALDTMWPAFQPLVDVVGRRVFAYEALMRTEERALPRPPDVLEAADRIGRLEDVGRVMRHRVALAAARLPQETLLFVNLHPRDLLDEELYLADAPLAAMAGRVVFEITERAALDGIGDVARCTKALRDLGYRVAVDDLGAGFAGLTSLVLLEPEIVKLDMTLIRGVDRDATRQHVIRAMVGLAGEMGLKVIAEGVETDGEGDALVSLGCALHQGWRYGKPVREFAGATFPPEARGQRQSPQ